MKNFILILITLTTIYAQTSAVDLYEQSQKALSMTIDEVEAIWAPIAANDDWSLLSAKLSAIHQMRQAYDVVDVPSPRIVGGAAC